MYYRSLADLYGPAEALEFDDPHGVCKISAGRMAAFQTNPFNVAFDGPAQLVVALDGQAAGRIMLLPGEIVVAGQSHSMAWPSDLYVVPEYRKAGLGTMLVKEPQNICHTLGGCHPSAMSYPMFKKLGWVDMPLSRYVLLRKSRSVLDRFLGPGRRAALLRPIVDGALLVHRCFLEIWGRMTAPGLCCKQVGSMPASMDRLLQEKVGAFGCHRSSRWLNWVLDNCFDSDPRNEKQLYLVFDRTDNLLAYFITRMKYFTQASHRGFENIYLGTVLDWMIFDDSAVSQEVIWLMATNLLGARGADAVEICTNSPDAGAKLLPLGFRPADKVHFVFVSDDEGPVIDEGQVPQWRLRSIDGDEGLW